MNIDDSTNLKATANIKTVISRMELQLRIILILIMQPSDNTDIQTNLDSIETETSASIKTTTNMKATTDIKIKTHINTATNRRDSVCD